jgi:hypothetical protein
MLHDEAALVIERENNRMATEASLLHAAGVALFSAEGGKHFFDAISSLGEDD